MIEEKIRVDIIQKLGNIEKKENVKILMLVNPAAGPGDSPQGKVIMMLGSFIYVNQSGIFPYQKAEMLLKCRKQR